jgi:hypothetical protein
MLCCGYDVLVAMSAFILNYKEGVSYLRQGQGDTTDFDRGVLEPHSLIAKSRMLSG